MDLDRPVGDEPEQSMPENHSGNGELVRLRQKISEMAAKEKSEKKRLYAALTKRHDAECAKLKEECEVRIAQLTESYSFSDSKKDSEIHRLAGRQVEIETMSRQLRQARTDLLAKFEEQNASHQSEIEKLHSEIEFLKTKVSETKADRDTFNAVSEISAGYIAEIQDLREQLEAARLAATMATPSVVTTEPFSESHNNVECICHNIGSECSRELQTYKDRCSAILFDYENAQAQNKVFAEKIQVLENMECAVCSGQNTEQAPYTELFHRRIESLLSNADQFGALVQTLLDEIALLNENQCSNASIIASLEAEVAGISTKVGCDCCSALIGSQRNLITDNIDTLRSMSADLDVLSGVNSAKESMISKLTDQVDAYKKQVMRLEEKCSSMETDGFDHPRVPVSNTSSHQTPSSFGIDDSQPHVDNAHDAAVKENAAKNFTKERSADIHTEISIKEVLAEKDQVIRSLEQEISNCSQLSNASIKSSAEFFDSLHRLDATCKQLEHQTDLYLRSGNLMLVPTAAWKDLRSRKSVLGLDQPLSLCYKCELYVEELSNWKALTDHLQSILSSVIEANSAATSSHDAGLGITNFETDYHRLKYVLKEHNNTSKQRLAKEKEKSDAMESKWLEEKKKVLQLGMALKTKAQKSSQLAAELNRAKDDVQAALFRAQTAETQILHLSATVEMLEREQSESSASNKNASARAESLTEELRTEKERIENFNNETQNLNTLLTQANTALSECQAAYALLTMRTSQLVQMVSSHWLFDIPADSDPQAFQCQILQRCFIDGMWWLLVQFSPVSGDLAGASGRQLFWTTIEAYDMHATKKIATGNFADAELVQNRDSCSLSSGVFLPRSLDFESESKLKQKFDKKWLSAARKYEKKVADLAAHLQTCQAEHSALSAEFSDYKIQANRALIEKSGDAVRTAELLDEIENLKLERLNLQKTIDDATKCAENAVNIENARLLRLIETERVAFHDVELKWSNELQEAHAENDRLIARHQEAESSVIATLSASLAAAQEELQRSRNSATKIVKDRDACITELHRQLGVVEDNSQAFQREIRVLEAEIASLKNTASSYPMQRNTEESIINSQQSRRPSTESLDQSGHVVRLQNLLRNAELQKENQSARLLQLEEQVAKLSKSQERSGANMDYLKHIIVKYMETDEKSTLLPVISNILAFDSEEEERIRTKLLKTAGSNSRIGKIW